MIDQHQKIADRLVDEWMEEIAHKDLKAWAIEALPILAGVARGERPKFVPFQRGSIHLEPTDTLEAFSVAGGDRLPSWKVASTTLVLGGVRMSDGQMALVVRPQ